MKKTRAKFYLSASVSTDGSMSVSGTPVYSEDPNSENKSFTDSTPSGNFQMSIAPGKEAQNNFAVGVTKEYYIDITEVEQGGEAAAQ